LIKQEKINSDCFNLLADYIIAYQKDDIDSCEKIHIEVNKLRIIAKKNKKTINTTISFPHNNEQIHKVL
jgi:hypothetical protein